MKPDTTPREPGVYENIPASDYHSWQGFSITAGLSLLKSPGHYKHRILNPIEPSDAMRLGSMVHLRLLEPELFWKRYVVVPDHIPRDRRTKDRKLWEEAHAGELATRELMESDQARRVEGIYQSVMGRECASAVLLGAGQSELSLFWHESGIACKGRLDKYQPDLKTLVDIKTTRDASRYAFTKTIAGSGYHIQAAHYQRGAELLGLEIEHVLIVAIETEAPFGVAVYKIPTTALTAGHAHKDKLLAILRQETEKDTWLAYPDDIQTLQFPDWAFQGIDVTLEHYSE